MSRSIFNLPKLRSQHSDINEDSPQKCVLRPFYYRYIASPPSEEEKLPPLAENIRVRKRSHLIPPQCKNSCSSLKSPSFASSERGTLKDSYFLRRLVKEKNCPLPAKSKTGIYRSNQLKRRTPGSFTARVANDQQVLAYMAFKEIFSTSKCSIYRCKAAESDKLYALKVYKEPRMICELTREVKILKALKSCPFIAQYRDMVKVSPAPKVGLVFDYVEGRRLLMDLPPQELPVCLHQVFSALTFCHSKSIIHCSLKLQHILVDLYGRARIIDWDEAEFCGHGIVHSCQKGIMAYRAPEMILEHPCYTSAVDMWSMGCIMASLASRVEPFFFGSTKTIVLDNIAQVMGSSSLCLLAKKLSILIDIEHRPRAKLDILVNKHNKEWYSHSMKDLIIRLLKVNPEERLTAKLCCQHEYFTSPSKLHS